MTPKSDETIKSTQGKDRWVVVLFGLFLGLCILKFGNPIILDQLIEPPSEIADLGPFMRAPLYALAYLAIITGVLVFQWIVVTS